MEVYETRNRRIMMLISRRLINVEALRRRIQLVRIRKPRLFAISPTHQENRPQTVTFANKITASANLAPPRVPRHISRTRNNMYRTTTFSKADAGAWLKPIEFSLDSFEQIQSRSYCTDSSKANSETGKYNKQNNTQLSNSRNNIKRPLLKLKGKSRQYFNYEKHNKRTPDDKSTAARSEFGNLVTTSNAIKRMTIFHKAISATNKRRTESNNRSSKWSTNHNVSNINHNNIPITVKVPSCFAEVPIFDQAITKPLTKYAATLFSNTKLSRTLNRIAESPQ